MELLPHRSRVSEWPFWLHTDKKVAFQMNNKKNYGCLYERSAEKKKNSMCQPATGSVWMTLETERHKQEQKNQGG